jgi:tRNA pseudouridine13 synthase
MSTEVPAGSRERLAGMEVFLTGTPPLRGRLRVRAEDFIVDEEGPEPPRDEKGRAVAVRVRLVNWEHNHFIRDACRRLHLPRRNVGFAGTKDKRAVTTQWLTFFAEMPEAALVERLSSMPRVEVLAHHRTAKSLHLGQHLGNRFRILVRDVPGNAEDVRANLGATLDEIRAAGGFPNFFGIQRFGAVRPVTHHVGRALLTGDLEEAILTYVTAPSAAENPELNATREEIRENRDWKQALRVLPIELKFERAMAERLALDPHDPLKAIRQLPANLLLLFVHAYQSYLFNRILSERIRRGLPLGEPLEGDLVLPMTHGEPIADRDPILVTSANIDKVKRQVEKDRASVTAPLIGYDTPMAQGEPGEIEAKILAESGIPVEAYRMQHLVESASRGLRRAILTRARDLEAVVHEALPDACRRSESPDARAAEDEAPEAAPTPGTVFAELRFGLPRGAYATTLLREILKAEETTDY